MAYSDVYSDVYADVYADVYKPKSGETTRIATEARHLLHEMEALGRMVELAILRTPSFWAQWREYVQGSFELGLCNFEFYDGINGYNHGCIADDFKFLGDAFLIPGVDTWRTRGILFKDLRLMFMNGAYKKLNYGQFYDEVLRPRALAGVIMERGCFYNFLKEHTTREWKHSSVTTAAISGRLCQAAHRSGGLAPELGHLAERGEASLALVLERLVAQSHALSRFVLAHADALERELWEVYGVYRDTLE